MTTEIYICRDGQSLKEGRVEYSEHVDTKDAAKSDAEQRCRNNTWIKKIVYYQVNDNGDFRIFYSHTNPNCQPTKPVTAAAEGTRKKTRTRKKQKPKTIWQKVKAVVWD